MQDVQRSLWFPVFLSVVVHLFLAVMFLQLRLMGSVFTGEAAKRLPELEKLAEADERRYEEFVADETRFPLRVPPKRAGTPSEPDTGESELPEGAGMERPWEPLRPPLAPLSPEGEEAALRAVERAASRPLLPPPSSPLRSAPVVGDEKPPGLPDRVLKPKLDVSDFEAPSPAAELPRPPFAETEPPRAAVPAPPPPALPPLPPLERRRPALPLDDDVDVKLELYRDTLSGETFFRLTLRVREESGLVPFPKDNLFLVDVSNSVKSDEMRAEFRGIMRVVSSLPAGDRYNVALFHMREETAFRDYRGWDPEDRDYLLAFLKRPKRAILTGLSGTIRRMLSRFPGEAGRPLNVYLFTDGLVTAGRTSVKAVTSRYSNVLKPHQSIFCLNVGRPYNPWMLEMIAHLGRGAFGDCPDAAGAEEALVRFVRKWSRPVLVEPEAEYLAPDVSEIYPRRLPNLYRDAPLRLYGKCRKGAVFVLRLRGLGRDGERDIVIRAAMPEPDENSTEIAREWARGRIYMLAERWFAGKAGREALSEMRSLSVRYGVGLPFDIDGE